jgi:hypothetical protein
MQPSCNWPFSEKHARQQASIFGNMQAAGLLDDAEATVYLELGAGKGYLGGLLAEVAKPQHLVLMDYRSNYKAKVRCRPPGVRGAVMHAVPLWCCRAIWRCSEGHADLRAQGLLQHTEVHRTALRCR